jgi:hypothetical protein
VFDHLAARFGVRNVFMDVEGGIRRGADFAETLRAALAGAEAVVAVVGPRWTTCTRSDGRRRLEVPDDWVRNEIATALRRPIPVVTVLVGGARLPTPGELPAELAPMLAREAAELSDSRWLDDATKLCDDLAAEISALGTPDDVAIAGAGLRRLQTLVARQPKLAAFVATSREVIENTSKKLLKLNLFKGLHDDLHRVEAECLHPLEAEATLRARAGSGGVAVPWIRSCRRLFAGPARDILQAARGDDLPPLLRSQLTELVTDADEALARALSAPGPDAAAAVLAALRSLLSGMPPRLEIGISDAVNELSLDRLIQLLDAIGKMVPAPAGPEPLADGASALHRLRYELRGRVAEHAGLQVLDSKLRTICVGDASTGTLPEEWRRVKRCRAALPSPPFTPELADAVADLAAAELEVDALMEREPAAARDALAAYFRSVSAAFGEVDRGLKAFSLRLGEVSLPLETMLALCDAPGA